MTSVNSRASETMCGAGSRPRHASPAISLIHPSEAVQVEGEVRELVEAGCEGLAHRLPCAQVAVAVSLAAAMASLWVLDFLQKS